MVTFYACTIILWRKPRNPALNSFFSPQSVKLGSVTYKKLDNSADYLPVRRRVEEIIEQAQFSTHTFSDNKHVSKIEPSISALFYSETRTLIRNA